MPLAQLGEHKTFNLGVMGSSPIWHTIFMGRYTVLGSGADCKSAGYASSGSNPERPTINGSVSEWFKELVLKTSDA